MVRGDFRISGFFAEVLVEIGAAEGCRGITECFGAVGGCYIGMESLF